MKLVELLARELDVWPEGVVQLTQSRVDDEIYSAGVGGDSQLSLSPEMFLSEFHSNKGENYPLVTRAEWQAERERIAGGWIAWGGGGRPVDVGAEIDLRLRCGEELIPASRQAGEWNWKHTVGSRDIIAYRLHKPEQASAEAIDAGIAAADAGQVKPIEEVKAVYEYNPIHTRNRILEIDRTTEALEEERSSLVQRLADEGFVLARADGKVAQSEPAEWKVGDLLEITGEEEGHEFEIGSIVRIEEIDHDDESLPYECAPVDGGREWWLNRNEAKFHHRPTA